MKLELRWLDLNFDNRATAAALSRVANSSAGREYVATQPGHARPTGSPRGLERLCRGHLVGPGGADRQAARPRAAALVTEPALSTPDQFGAFMKDELAKYEKVVKASGATVD